MIRIRIGIGEGSVLFLIIFSGRAVGSWICGWAKGRSLDFVKSGILGGFRNGLFLGLG